MSNSNDVKSDPDAWSQNLWHFRNWTRDLESPNHFFLWNYLFIVASCLGRKIWLGQKPYQTFPNLYVIFVAKPGKGKSRPAGVTEEILRELVSVKVTAEGQPVSKKLIHLAPDTTSFEKMLQRTSDATETYKDEKDPSKGYLHTSVCFCMDEELGTLFRHNTEDIVTFLTKGWDCKNYESDFIKHGAKEIYNTCINFLGCCTPKWMSRNITSGLFNDGFTARIIFIFGDKPRFRRYKQEITSDMRESYVAIVKHLRTIATLPPSEITYTSEADEWLKWWVENEQDKSVINADKRLEDYYGRKRHHLIKLAMLCHFADKTSLCIDRKDFVSALRILELAEVDMHRALSTSGATNNLFVISQAVLETIRSKAPSAPNKGLTIGQLILEHWDIAQEDQTRLCVDFLKNTGQIANRTVDGISYFHISKD